MTEEKDDLSIAYMAGFYKGQDSIKDQNCNGCIHKPKEGENYPEVCGTCCRWYGDEYEAKWFYGIMTDVLATLLFRKRVILWGGTLPPKSSRHFIK